MKKIFIHILGIILSLIIVGPIILVVSDRSLPFIFENAVMLTKLPRPGDVVTVQWTGKFKRECDGVIHRSIIDAGYTIHLLTPISSVLSNFDEKAGTSYTWTRTFNLPLAVKSGPALYKTIPEYWCNPFQKSWPIRIHVYDIEFIISEGGPRLKEL